MGGRCWWIAGCFRGSGSGGGGNGGGSRGTAELLKLLLPDSARLQEEEAEYRNRKNLTRHNPALPLYTEQDARAALKLLRPQENRGEAVEVGGGVRAAFTIAGDI